MSCDFLSLAAPGVRALRPYQPGKPESELAREYGLSLESIVKLASNENPLGPSPKALAAIEAALPQLTRYPDGNGFELKAALAEKHGVPLDCITLGNGSNDILELVARAFLQPEYEAIFSAHAFAVYPIATQAVGAVAKVAPALPADHPAMPYGHDLAAILSLITPATRVIFIANPNNPTGTWVDAASLRQFLSQVPEQVLVVLDEAYTEFAGEVADYQSGVDWVDQFPNLLVSRTFSKAYGLAALRVGYSISHPQIADILNRVRQPFNVNSLALVAAVAALHDQDYLAHAVALNQAGRVQLLTGLQALGFSALPSLGNFLCVDLQGLNGRELFNALLPKGVILRPVDNYGLPGFIRITIGTERENARCLEAMRQVLAERNA